MLIDSHHRKVDNLQSSLGLSSIIQKHSALIGLVNLSEYLDNCSHLITPVNAYQINKSVFRDGERDPNKLAMFAGDNPLTDAQTRLKTALSRVEE